MANKKPTIVILATGGTIAGSAASALATTGYRAGTLGIDALMEAVPQVREYANVAGEQICGIDSKDMTDALWLRLAKRVNELLAKDDVDGIVITHGTDTMEETAYFLQLTVKSDKPVALTGAMRPATAVSADGPMNLLDAVRVSASGESFGKGVLVVMNGEIHGAREVRKADTLSVGAFQSPGGGPLGHVQDGVPAFLHLSLRCHTRESEFDISGITELPYVKVLYGHADDDGLFADAAVSAGAKGLVYAGMGNGSIPAAAEMALEKASSRGVVVVRSTRTGSGAVIASEPSYENAHFLRGDSLSPQKARILLQLALLKTTDLTEIQRMFGEY